MTIYRPTVAQEMGGDHSINKAEYGDKIDEITVTAKTVKTHGLLVEDAKASQGKLTFRVKSSAFTLNDAFNGVWANGSQRGTLQKVL